MAFSNEIVSALGSPLIVPLSLLVLSRPHISVASRGSESDGILSLDLWCSIAPWALQCLFAPAARIPRSQIVGCDTIGLDLLPPDRAAGVEKH